MPVQNIKVLILESQKKIERSLQLFRPFASLLSIDRNFNQTNLS